MNTHRCPHTHRNLLASALAAMMLLVAFGSVSHAERGRLRRLVRRLSPFGQRAQRARQLTTNTQTTAPTGSFEQRVKAMARQHNLKTYNKNGKVFFEMKNAAFNDYKNLGPNVVEFMVSPGFHHLYTRIGDQTYSRISGLSRSRWYSSSSQRIGVLVELKDHEMRALKDFLARAERNPHQVLGPFVYGGGRPPNASNCTSYITNAKVGRNNESLARVCGTYESGMPQGWLSSLMRSNSDRVKGIVVHNPKGTFSADYHLDMR